MLLENKLVRLSFWDTLLTTQSAIFLLGLYYKTFLQSVMYSIGQ
jgi:hypothetical protein